jgi:hypothetical protein
LNGAVGFEECHMKLIAFKMSTFGGFRIAQVDYIQQNKSTNQKYVQWEKITIEHLKKHLPGSEDNHTRQSSWFQLISENVFLQKYKNL